jgi:hypothetical protein
MFSFYQQNMKKSLRLFLAVMVTTACSIQCLFATTSVFRSIAADDGYITESGENTDVGNAAATDDSGDLRAGDSATKQQIKLIVSFDTSSLPANAHITNAVLRLRRASRMGSTPHNVIGPAYADIRSGDGFGGDLTLSASDFQARTDAAEVAQMSIPASNGDWSEGTLDALGRRGIDPSGHTQFRVYHIADDNNNSQADYINYHSGEASVSDAPQLVVEYTIQPPISRPHFLNDPDTFHGLRTKWERYFEGSGGETRASISPEMRGLNHARWGQAIERIGANGCSLNVEARNNLLASAKYPLTDLTPQQISEGQFTPDQRNSAQMRFLLGLEDAREAGLILGSFRFSLHQRFYPNKDAAKEQQFVDDHVGFIKCAKAMQLDHWIRGIRLGENGISENDLWYMMDLTKRWATAINADTGNWLKTHGMEMHGGGFGIHFNGINTRSNASTFFQAMSQQTGYFTWCFKFFYDGNFGDAMTDAGLNQNNAADIKTFLRTACGFANLETFIAAYRNTYPMHANCIFVGDSGDAMRGISNVEHQALTQLFNEAGEGFRGIMAVNGFSWEDENNQGNQFKAIYKVTPTGSDPLLNPASYARWSAWPNIEAGNTDPLIATDARVGDAMTFSLADQIESGPAWLASAGGKIFGTPQPADLGVNTFRLRSPSGVEKTLLITVLDNLHLNPGFLSIRTAPGRTYSLETSSNLTNWLTTPNIRVGDGSIWTVPYTTNLPAQFFRIQTSPSP